MYKILVVDDEKWIRKGIINMIDRAAYEIGEVYEAGTVREAIESFRQNRPDIVLTDICFPTENGCTLGEFLYHEDPRVRIVMISAYSEFVYAQKAIAFRAVDYLLKPVTKEKLNQTIAICVEDLVSSAAVSDSAVSDSAASASAASASFSSSDDSAAFGNSSVFIVRSIAAYAKNNYQKKLNLSELAKKYHINEAYLSHVFKEEIGLSFVSYLTKIRIDEACRLIREQHLRLRTVAEKVGYDDYQYFVRVFKKTMNVSPSEYQDKLPGQKETEPLSDFRQ